MEECFKIEQGLLILDKPKSSGTALYSRHQAQRRAVFNQPLLYLIF